jgi:hypothetical protein
MKPSINWVLGFLLLAWVFVLFSKWFSIRQVFKGRQNLDEGEIEKLFYRETETKSKNVLLVLKFVSESYRVKKGFLRPEDRFDQGLAVIDSWLLGEGLEALVERLRIQVKIEADIKPGTTLGDLVTQVNKALG